MTYYVYLIRSKATADQCRIIMVTTVDYSHDQMHYINNMQMHKFYFDLKGHLWSIEKTFMTFMTIINNKKHEKTPQQMNSEC